MWCHEINLFFAYNAYLKYWGSLEMNNLEFRLHCYWYNCFSWLFVANVEIRCRCLDVNWPGCRIKEQQESVMTNYIIIIPRNAHVYILEKRECRFAWRGFFYLLYEERGFFIVWISLTFMKRVSFHDFS